MKIIGIIPARYQSTRLPGKPLMCIQGKPMIQRTWEQASKCLDEVIVATDDTRISEVVEKFGGKALITSLDCKNGTERCAEVMKGMWEYDVIINIQGDEPFIQPEQIQALIEVFKDKKVQIATLAKSIIIQKAIDPDTVKVVFNKNKKALYFSRSIIPFPRVEGGEYYKHLGIYAYRWDVLEQLAELPMTMLERTESLEQNRWLTAGYEITIVETNVDTISIDTYKDLKL